MTRWEAIGLAVLMVVATLAVGLDPSRASGPEGGTTLPPTVGQAVAGFESPVQLVDCQSSSTPVPRPSWAEEISQPAHEGVLKAEHTVESRDGTPLSVTVYRPSDTDEPLPTVLVLSPYHATAWVHKKELEDVQVYEYADCMVPYLTARGYNVALADLRGTHNSGGCFAFGGPKDTEDGLAIVDWIADQPWATGSVGMFGTSHVGMSQLLTAMGTPEALKAIVPIAAPTQFYRHYYMNGAKYAVNTVTVAAYLPVVDLPPPTNAHQPHYPASMVTNGCGAHEYLPETADTTGDFDAFWQARDYVAGVPNYGTAVLLVHGFQDDQVKTDNFPILWDALQEHGITSQAILTQHGHSQPKFPWWNLTAVRWFDHHLKGLDTGMLDHAPVTIQRSDGSWENTTDWPPPGLQPTELHLHQGHATFQAPTDRSTASYQDNPLTRIEEPQAFPGDRLVYTSEPLEAPLKMTGQIGAEITAMVDRTDANLVVHVYENTTEGDTQITRGYLDARHHESLETGEDLVPGETYTFSFELYPRSHVLQPGSRLKVVIASSDLCHTTYCEYGGIVSDRTAPEVTVHEGPGATRLILPVEGDSPARP